MKNKRSMSYSAFLCAFAVTIHAVVSLALPLQEQDTVVDEQQEQEAAVSVSPAEEILLKKDTEVKIVFAQTLSSKHSTVDEKVELRVAEDVRVGDTIVIAKGTRVLGTVTSGKKNEKYGNSKILAVRIDYVAVKDRRIPLTGMQEQKPNTNIGVAAVATAGLGFSGLMIYMNQRESWIREGTPVVGYIAEDVVFTP